MNIRLDYKKEWDNIPKDKLAEAYFCFLALSCSLDFESKNTDHYEIIKSVVDKYNDKSNEVVWYFVILTLLETRTKIQRYHYLNGVIKNMKTAYSERGMPKDICSCVENINNILPCQGYFTSLYENLEENDTVLLVWASIKEEVKEKCEKYFVFKNVQKEFLEKTMKKEFVNSEYINQFDFMFDVLIMFFIHAIEELISTGLINNENEVRAFLFSSVEQYSAGMFIKNSNKIADAICQSLASRTLAMK